MTLTDLARMGAALEERSARLARLDAYYAGTQPLTYIAPEAREALRGRLSQVSVNVPRLVVSSLVERLRVTGFLRDGRADSGLWATWRANDLDQLAPVAHREALALGAAHVIVWAGRRRRAAITVESPHQVLVERDPATREVTAAIKRWSDPAPAGGTGAAHHAVVFGPDRITRWRAAGASAPATFAGWTAVESLRNPLGVVPVVPLVNTERLLDLDGRSEFTDVIPLVDALVKLTTDMLVTSEFFARPRRWATGVEVPTDEAGEPINPFASDADRTWISEAPESKFGQFAATDLAAYDTATKVVLQQISAVAALPEHYLGITTSNPSSADAIRSAEAALTARAEARQAVFGRAWEQVARLAVAVETGADPAAVDVAVSWADPATRSVAQDADAAVKLVAAGILPAAEALRRLGYGDDDIARLTAAPPALVPAVPTTGA